MRERTRSKMRAMRERRRHVAEGLAAGGALLRADDVGPEPTAAFLASRIDTLNGGARH
jgi:hypothetical protein